MKRRLLIIAVLLLLGAVVNVAVAWGCALWSVGPKFYDVYNGMDGTIRLYEVYSAGGNTRHLKHALSPPLRDIDWDLLPGREVAYDDLSGFGFLRIDLFDIPDDLQRPASRFGVYRTFFYELKVGWPMWVLRTEATRNADARFFDRQYDYAGAILLRRRVNMIFGAVTLPRPLPTRPIWPGFAINTIFYAALLWLLLLGPSALQRFLRLRRGLCPRCAYPMGKSSICTECGKPLPSRLRVA